MEISRLTQGGFVKAKAQKQSEEAIVLAISMLKPFPRVLLSWGILGPANQCEVMRSLLAGILGSFAR